MTEVFDGSVPEANNDAKPNGNAFVKSEVDPKLDDGTPRLTDVSNVSGRISEADALLLLLLFAPRKNDTSGSSIEFATFGDGFVVDVMEFGETDEFSEDESEFSVTPSVGIDAGLFCAE